MLLAIATLNSDVARLAVVIVFFSRRGSAGVGVAIVICGSGVQRSAGPDDRELQRRALYGFLFSSPLGLHRAKDTGTDIQEKLAAGCEHFGHDILNGDVPKRAVRVADRDLHCSR